MKELLLVLNLPTILANKERKYIEKQKFAVSYYEAATILKFPRKKRCNFNFSVLSSEVFATSVSM